ncbi:MAG: flagellar motor switch protein FliM [Burkholderiaceae bacterium]|nr:flagellar motor switch protein FliM [Burkholderiaceae bacterium]
MTEAFLSQDEVDALLDGVEGSDDARATADEVGNGAGEAVHAFDLGRREQVVRAHMPVLELAHERFARHLASALSGFVGRKPVVSASPARIRQYAETMREIAAPAHFNLMLLEPLRGNALLVCESQLVSGVVDALFGGVGRPHPQAEEREFSTAELHIGRRIVDVACEAWRKAWAGTYPLVLEHVRSESHPRFIGIAAAGDLVVSAKFDIEIGGASGALHLCIPHAVLEPIRQTLYSTQPGDTRTPDRRWTARLSRQLEAAEVEVVAELGHARATVADLVALKAGDFIELDLDQTLQATIDGVPVLSCRYGISNGRYAIKVQSFLTVHPDHPNGAPHGER